MQYLAELSRNCSQKEKVLFDVGANKGQYINQLHPYFQNSQIYCFEPSPMAFSILSDSTNNMNNVKCYQLGIGHKETTLDLQFNTEGSVMASFSPLEIDDSSRMRATSQLTTIDSFCQTNGIDEIYLLKLDIEGFELNALKGAESMIKKNKVNYIQFEFGKNNIQQGIYLKNFFDILRHYKLSRVLKDGLKELSKHELRYEIILTTNYLAELR